MKNIPEFIAKILTALLIFVAGLATPSLIHHVRDKTALNTSYSSVRAYNKYPATTVVKIEGRSYIYAEETGEEVVEVFVISDGKSFDLAIVSNNESIPKDCKFMLRLCDSKTNATSYVAWPKYNLTKK